MTAPLPLAQSVRDHGHQVVDACVLTYDQRFLRRKRLVASGGLTFLVDLPQTMSLEDGNVFVLDDGREIAVRAAIEPLLRVSGASLAQLAWHIGNRHCPCQMAPDHLLIRPDHVLRDMLVKLGAEVTDVTAPFTPAGGAYGVGRTHGHDHDH